VTVTSSSVMRYVSRNLVNTAAQLYE